MRWVAILGLALTACGGGKSATPLSLADLQAKAGCSDIQPISSPPMYASEAVHCTVNGQTARLSTFPDAGALSNWRGVAAKTGCAVNQSLGITSINYVTGTHWVIETPSASAAQSIATATGGTAVSVKC